MLSKTASLVRTTGRRERLEQATEEEVDGSQGIGYDFLGGGGGVVSACVCVLLSVSVRAYVRVCVTQCVCVCVCECVCVCVPLSLSLTHTGTYTQNVKMGSPNWHITMYDIHLRRAQ